MTIISSFAQPLKMYGKLDSESAILMVFRVQRGGEMKGIREAGEVVDITNYLH